jgi:GH24 family phage-related lysozyme (muramidase)
MDEFIRQMALMKIAQVSSVATTPYEYEKLEKFLMKHEGFHQKPYKDSNGQLAIGFGSQFLDGKRVTPESRLTMEQARKILRQGIDARAQRLAKILPGWNEYDNDMRSALIDVGFGKDSVLTAKKSPSLHKQLNAAMKLKDRTQRIRAFADAIYKEIPTYTKSDNEKYRAGLKERRQANIDTFLVGTKRRNQAKANAVTPTPVARTTTVAPTASATLVTSPATVTTATTVTTAKAPTPVTVKR